MERLKNRNKPIIIAYIALSILFIFSLFKFFVGLQLRGFYTPKIVAWVWLISTIALIIYYWKNKFAKIYLGSLVGIIVLSILPMMIPFFAILFHFSNMGVKQHFNLGNDYRLEQKQTDPLSFQHLYIYRPKYFIFDETLAKPVYNAVLDTTFPTYSENQIDELSDLPIENAKLIKIDAKTIVLNLKIKGVEKRVEIQLYENL